MYNHFFLPFCERWLGRPEKAIEITDGIFEEARRTWNLKVALRMLMIRSLAIAEFGRIEEAIKILNEGIDLSEKFGESISLAMLYNSLGYCYQEIYHPEKALIFNSKSCDVAHKIAKKSTLVRQTASEIFAQAAVNLMENIFDQEKTEEARRNYISFSEESKSDDFDRSRDQRESRMNYLAAQIMLYQNNIVESETFIRENLENVREQRLKKREGCFLRLLGETQMRSNQSDKAISNFNEAIKILKGVGNPRQLWQAHASLGAAFDTLDRFSEAKEQWGAASVVIQKTAKDLSDRDLRQGFLNARPIQEILVKAND